MARIILTEDGVTEQCRVFWRSHGCALPRFHEGDSLSHECDPCPPDCVAPPDEDMLLGHEDGVFNGRSLIGEPIMADCCGMCSVHCGDRPDYEDDLRGDDVDFFPKRSGVPA